MGRCLKNLLSGANAGVAVVQCYSQKKVLWCCSPAVLLSDISYLYLMLKCRDSHFSKTK